MGLDKKPRYITRIKRCNITNNNIVPVDQAGREQLLGNAISCVWWGNNMTNIGRASFHLAGNCARYWIRYYHEHRHCHYPLPTQQFTVPEDVITGGDSTFISMQAELLPRPGVNSNRMSFSSFLEFLKEETRGCDCTGSVRFKCVAALSVNGWVSCGSRNKEAETWLKLQNIGKQGLCVDMTIT